MTARFVRMAQAVLICAIVATELAPAFPDAPVSVAVVLSRDATPYRQAVKGFEQALRAAGRAYKLHTYSMEGGIVDEAALAQKIRSRRPDLVLTVGSGATSIVSERIHDIPIVFSMVLPSSGSIALEDLRANRRNITGSSMEIPLKTQFEQMRAVLPDLKRIGVLFDPEVTVPTVEAASLAASELGLELVPVSVSSEQNVLARAEALAGDVDALWSVADSTVFSPQGLKQVLLATLRNRLPFVGLSPSFVKAGALLAFSVDYMDVGRQSGEIAVRVLSGEEPRSIPITAPRSIALSVNMNTARQIQVSIGEEIRKNAEIFF